MKRKYYDDYEDDRGANDEGYYYTFCYRCDRRTEHDPCSGCCSCHSQRYSE